MRRLITALAVMVMGVVISGCDKAVRPIESGKVSAWYAVQSPFESFRDIPDLTSDEIRAIEMLKTNTGSFIYGTTPSSESFIGSDGEIHGFTALFCDWMTDLLDIPVKPVIYSWGNLMNGMRTGEIDFTGELTPTEERRGTYFMTSAIAERAIKYFRLEGSLPFVEIAQSRPLRYAFFTGTTTWRIVADSFSGLDYETVFIDDSSLVYDMLKNGEIDAFFNEGPGEYAFDVYGDVGTYSFIPLINEPVSLATRNPAFDLVISVMQKAILNGGRNYLAAIYNHGYDDYRKHKLYLRLTEEERAYIRNNPVIPIVAEYDNYPVSFYNYYEKEMQGIAFDVIREIEQLTGLTFEQINKQTVTWSEMLEMVKDGKAAMIAELLRSKEREGMFLWSKNPILLDNYALVSKFEYPNLSLNEILSTRVALMKETAYTDLFNIWFPDHTHTFKYDNYPIAFEALARGEVDMVMSSRKELLSLTNYHEIPGYKANFVFDQTAESLFGFNINEVLLAGIIDKAVNLIDTKSISGNWMFKTFDYRAKVAEARLPWLIGAIGLSLCVIALVFVLFQRGRQYGRHLEQQVRLKTAELKAVIDSYKGVIWSVDREKNITIFGGQYLKKLGIPPSFLLGKNLEVARQKNRHLDIIEKVDQTFKEGAQDWISEIDGTLFRSNTTPVYGAEGNVIGVVGSNDDITELITLQQNLETAVKEANRQGNDEKPS
jgi:ABC-type amino acid transport substrate-binding protein